MLGTGGLVMALLGTDPRESLIVGACLSLSSTIVVLKQLIDRGEMDSAHGRAAVGWSIVQDIATIVFIVALPPLAGGDVIVPFARGHGQGRRVPGPRLCRRDALPAVDVRGRRPPGLAASCSCSRWWRRRS